MPKIGPLVPMPEMPKGIVINGGLDAPLVVYGKSKSVIDKALDGGDVIIFDEGVYTPKSVGALEVLRRWKDTGLVLEDSFKWDDSLSKPKIKVGSTVQVSHEGIWAMGPNYWMNGTTKNTFVVTGFFSSGTRCKCAEGVLPPSEYLTVIGSAYDAVMANAKPQAIEYNPWQDGHPDWLKAIKEAILSQYGDELSTDDMHDVLNSVKFDQQIIDSFDKNGRVLNEMLVDTNYFEFRVVAHKFGRDYLIDYMSNQDPEFLSGYNTDFLERVFPEIGNAWKALAESSSYNEIGNLLLSLPDGISKLIDSLIAEYSLQQILGDNCNYYDNKALEFAYSGEKYYLLRYD